MQLWVKVLVFVSSWIVLFSLFTFYMSVHPRKIVTHLVPSDLRLKYEEISFKTKDGIKLSGWYIPHDKSKKAVIIMHGYPADKANLLGMADFIAQEYNVFLFDFRSFGQSEGKYTTIGYLEKNDLLAAIDYLEKEKNITSIGLFGFSMGGAVALMTKHENVKAIVSDSTYSRLSNMVKHMYGIFSVFKYPLAYLTKIYGMIFLNVDIDRINPVESIQNIDKPILLIHGENDSQIPVAEGYALHEASNNSQLWIVKGADHGATHSIDQDEYEKKVLEFFRKSLG